MTSAQGEDILFSIMVESWIDSLKNFFGYNSFRAYQEEIIAACMGGKDVVAILPTGAGKSICYQLPAMMKNGTAIIVSPLISLMQDQVVSLAKNGLPVAFINSSLPVWEIQETMESISRFKMVYVAPERLATQEFLERLKSVEISMFAIDEAHCISQWGHEFRPEYRQLSVLKKRFPKIPVMALTATATVSVEKDIIKQLAMENPFVVRSSFDRPNLTFRIEPKEDGKLIEFLKKHQGESGIVYVPTRNGVEETFDLLKREGFSVEKYHAGLSDSERGKGLRDFLYKEGTMMVATVAFGMGIHKPDIRFIVHLGMPRSIEQYYQEVGRAGRDALPAECLMLHSAEEMRIYKLFLEKLEDPVAKEQSKKKTEEMVRLCRSSGCRRRELLRYFGETTPSVSCSNCDICLGTAAKIDATLPAKKILSCVYRLEQRYGVQHLMDVLRGEKTMNVMRRGHERLSTFGLMSDMKEREVRSYIEALIESGLLKRVGEYSVIQWTERTKEALKQEKILIPKGSGELSKKKGDGEEPLYQKLKELRRKLAENGGVPAFTVFHDRTLREMCRLQPKNEEEFLQIDGVGPVKWKRYGKQFLLAISRK